jgi:uncharacterized membrane protein HdeD (DUF308 family)
MDGSSLLIVRGVLGVVIGLLAMLWPGVTIAVLVVIFGVYALIDGLSNLFHGLRPSRTHGPSWAMALQGFVGIAAGVVAFVWPGITAFAVVMLIGAWALVTGVLELIAAIRFRREVRGEWLLALSGLLSIAFGVLVFLFPAAGAVGIAWILGAYAAAAGVVLIVLGMRLRSLTPA